MSRRRTSTIATLLSSAVVVMTPIACAQITATTAPAMASEAMSQEEAIKFIAAQRVGPDLGVGDKAPKLSVTDWVQGEPISGFESGSTYVVEMWAEWCGPCVQAIPHVNSLHEKYQKAGKPVEFIGMNIWDDKPDEDAAARLARIKKFVDKRSDSMTYRVAIEQTLPTPGAQRPQGVMARDWMEAAGRNGIPCAFIVDGEGEIAWIGHPMAIDEPLEDVVNGSWDKDNAAQESAKASEAQKGPMLIQRAMEGIRSDDAAVVAESYKTLEALSLTLFADEARFFPWVAQQVIGAPGVTTRDLTFAQRMAQTGCDMTSWSEPQPIAILGLANIKAESNDAGREYLSMAMRVAGQDVEALNAMAWTIMEDEELADVTAHFALGMSHTACDNSGWKNGDAIDTYARALWLSGQHDEAIEAQAKAVAAAETPDARANYESTLRKYKAAN